MEDQDLRYCKLCLATEVKMFSMNTPAILEAYSQLVQIVICETFELYICYECVNLLHKYEEFRSKCITALNVLSSINMDHSKITREVVQSIDRKFYNLDSQLQFTSMLVCNSNDQNVNDDFNNDETLLKHINPDLVIKQESYKIEFENKEPIHNNMGFPNEMIFESKEYVLDKNGCESDLNDSRTKEKHLKKEEENTSTSNTVTQEYKLSLSKDDNCGSDKKQVSVPKLKKTKKNSSKSSTDSQEHNTSFTNEIVFPSNDNDHVPEIKKKQLTGTKLNKRKNSTKSVGRMNSFEEFQLFNKDYVAVVPLTPDDITKEVLLRKESTNYKKNPYKCDNCYKGFGYKLTFENHMRKHSPEFGNLVCEYCHVRFTTKTSLSSHKYRSHSFKFSCVICPYVCYCYAQAVKHINFHKGKTYQCNECGLNFSMPSTLFAHKKFKHPTEVVCELCGSMFATPKGLYLHKKMLHRQENVEITGPKCEECDVQFATETAFKRHLVLSSKHTVRNGCEHCGETFNDKKDLKTHWKLHTTTLRIYGNQYRKLPAACEICGTWLKTDREYQSHMMSLHPNSSKSQSFVCEVCGKVFLHNSLLETHKAIHSNQRPYKCSECEKTFKSRIALDQHENRHTRKRVFQCDLCQKEYVRKSELVKHIKAHFGIRPYKCTFCDKSFPVPYELRLHRDYVHFKKPWPKRDRTKRIA